MKKKTSPLNHILTVSVTVAVSLLEQSQARIDALDHHRRIARRRLLDGLLEKWEAGEIPGGTVSIIIRQGTQRDNKYEDVVHCRAQADVYSVQEKTDVF